MRVALDANRFTDLARGLPDAVRIVETAEEVFLPFAVAAELKHGFRRGSRQHQNEALLAAFLAKPNCGLIFPDEVTLDLYADLQAQLAKQGTPIPSNDVWIAAVALQHDPFLYTRDDHFKQVPQLKLI
jgi:tRNA(fMet)-specific endonuclease VapC